MAEEAEKQAKQAELADRVRELIATGARVEITISEDKDSITLGAPTSGQLKVHGDAGRPQSWAHKIEMTQKLLEDARDREATSRQARVNGKV